MTFAYHAAQLEYSANGEPQIAGVTSRKGGAVRKEFWILFIAAILIVPLMALWHNVHRTDGIWADAVIKSPLKQRPHLNYGNELQSVGYEQRALEQFNQVLVLDGDRDEYRTGAAVNISGIYLARGDYRRAIDVLEREGIRTGAMAGNIAVALMRLGERDRAEKYLLDAAVKWPDSDAVYANLAEARRGAGDCTGWDFWASKAERINPMYIGKRKLCAGF